MADRKTFATRGREQPEKEFVERVIEINRVTRVVAGGKRLRFRSLVVVGDRKGRVAYGIGKAGDVSQSIAKAVSDAKKRMGKVFLQEGSIPYGVKESYKSAHILLKPARRGSGVIAGGPVRAVLEIAGVKDIAGKMLGSSNKISNVIATIQALTKIRDPKIILAQRGMKPPAKESSPRVKPHQAEQSKKKEEK